MNIDLLELLTFCSVREVVVIRAICEGYKPQEIARAHNTTARKVQQVRDHAIRRMRRIIIRDLNLKPTQAMTPMTTTPTQHPGDIRDINGVPALIIKVEDDGTFLACPVKAMVPDEETTGNVVIVEEYASTPEELLGKIIGDHLFGGVAVALPEFSAAIYPEHIGKLLWRCFPQQTEKAAAGRTNVFRDVPPGTFDIMKPNAEEDWNLYRKMSAPSMEKMFALEADTFIEEPDGTMRPETARERRNRLARRRRALSKKH